MVSPGRTSIIEEGWWKWKQAQEVMCLDGIEAEGGR
jgi:hypothetical protein